MSSLAQRVAVLKAAADPVRTRILSMLEGGELCVCQIVAVLSLPASTVSRHLSALKGEGLVRERKAGKWIHYALLGKEASPEVRRLVRAALAGLSEDPTIAADTERTAARTAGAEAVCAAGMKLPKAPACCSPAGGGRSVPRKVRSGGIQ